MAFTRLTKLTSLLLAMGLALSLAACGGGASSAGTQDEASADNGGQSEAAAEPAASAGDGDKTTIRFWTFHTNDEREFMESLATRYAEVEPNVEVVYENFPESDYMGSKLTTAFAAGDGPDVFVMSPGDFLKYANSGVAMDLSPYFTDEVLGDFLPSSIEAVTVDGKIMAIPFEIELLGLYYNIDMFADAGIEPPATWDELVAATAALTTDEVSGLVIEPTKGYYQNFVWYPFMWQTGANVLDADTKTATFEGAGVESALQLWGDLVNAGAPAKLSIPLSNEIALMGNGQAAMQECGTWAVAALENSYADTNIGLVPLPTPEGGQAATSAGGWKMMVNSQSENADAAAKFAMWAFAENVEIPLEWCTEIKFAYSPRTSVIDAGSGIYSQGLRKVFTEEIYPSAVGEPRYPAEVVNAVGDALQAVMLAGGDPAEEAAKANAIIQDFLDNFEGEM